MRERDLFIEVLKLDDPVRRQEYLSAACGDDRDLLGRVEQLLAEHERQETFILDASPLELDAAGTIDQPREMLGTQIGPYKLLQQIGEGGMGVVYMAEQTEPVARRVALKIIKPGMDSRQVIARFEAERQALAMMDHPNIAKVLDAGTTGEPEALASGSLHPPAYAGGSPGRPYFVMELVKGVPITQFCDERQLTLRQRLELFVPVCQAIQHAHTKGIIHRDIKPTNVLIALYDGVPVPKVIDFGVAKATGPRLTEKTMFTQFGQLVGTLEYMSPEQAQLNQLDIDTRSDIYSLGVVLYELLTGSTPFDRKKLQSAAFDEMLRIIREEEPRKPSTKLSTSAALPAIAASRGMEPQGLPKAVRGELDWIVMKCLEKERTRRYEMPGSLARDIERFLADEPVQACPPSLGYRLRKFVRRQKARLAVAALVTFTLLIAIGGVAGGIGWAMRDRAAVRQQIQRDKAEQLAQVERDAARALEEVRADYLDEKLPQAMAALKHAEGLIAGRDASADVQIAVRRWRTDLDMVARVEQIRLEQTGIQDDGRWDWSAVDRAYREAFGQFPLDVESLEPAEAASKTDGSPIRAELALALDHWAIARRQLPAVQVASWRHLLAAADVLDPDPVRSQIRRVWGGNIPNARSEIEQLAASLPGQSLRPATAILLARAMRSADLLAEAEALLRETQSQNPADFWINFELAYHVSAFEPRRNDEAVSFYRAALAARPSAPLVHTNLGVALANQGERQEAERAHREAIRLAPKYGRPRWLLGNLYRDQKNWTEAIAAYEDGLRFDNNSAEPYAELAKILANCPQTELRHPARAREAALKSVAMSPNWTWSLQQLGWAEYRCGNWQAAIDALRKSCDTQGNAENGDSYQWYFLAMSHWQLGDKEEAARWYDLAVDWTRRHGQENDEELGLLAEASALLGRQLPPWRLLSPARTLAKSSQWNEAALSYVAALEQLPADLSWNSPRSRTCLELAQWDDVFAQVVELRPRDNDLWIGRGRFLASRRRWQQAAEAYARVIDQVPAGDAVVEYACVLVLAGDEAGHEQYCERAAARIDSSTSAASHAAVARACAAAETLPVAAQMLLSWTQEHAADSEPTAALAAAEGLVHLRAGQFANARQRSIEGIALPAESAGHVLCWLVRTIAEHRLGDRKTSLESLQQGFEPLGKAEDYTPADRLQIELLLQQLPAEEEFYLRRAHYYAACGRYSEARECYASLASPPNMEYACVLLLTGDKEGYRAFCRKISAPYGPNHTGVVHFVVPAICAFDAESGIDSAQILRWAESAVAEQRNKFTLHALAAAELRAGKLSEAIGHVEEALRDHGAHPSSVAIVAALACHSLGREAEARSWFELAYQKLREATPKDPQQPAPWAVSHWLVSQVEIRDAAEVLGIQIKPALLQPQSPQSLRKIAQEHLRARRFDEAAAVYLQAIESLPVQLGTVSLRKRIGVEAAQSDEVFRRLIVLRPYELELWTGRGKSHLLRQRWPEAAAAYEKVIDQHPIDDDHFEYASLLAMLDRQAVLESFLERTVARTHAIVGPWEWFVLARTAAIVPQDVVSPEQAVKWGRDAVAREDHAWFRHALSLAHYRAGEFQQAIDESYKSDARSWNEAGKGNSHLVRALSQWKLGRKEEARQTLVAGKKLLDAAPPPAAGTPITEWLESRLLLKEAQREIEIAAEQP